MEEMVRHVCRTTDGVAIELGLRVQDYDWKWGVVAERPRESEMKDEVCWPCPGHGGHWWGVCPDREGHVHEIGICRGAEFDGSRLSKKGWRS